MTLTKYLIGSYTERILIQSVFDAIDRNQWYHDTDFVWAPIVPSRYMWLYLTEDFDRLSKQIGRILNEGL